jgi:hypothetical protein
LTAVGVSFLAISSSSCLRTPAARPGMVASLKIEFGSEMARRKAS